MTAVLLDFFGTLVDYSPGRAAQGCPLSHRLALDPGAGSGYDAFVADLDRVFATFDRRSDTADEEFSMAAVAEAFLTGQLARTPEPAEVTAFEEIYIQEWSAGVAPFDGVPRFLEDLRARHRLAERLA
jgi:FMN phosphatase YigB (HAD superfamily)